MQSETAPASHPDFPSHLPLIHHNISFLLHRYGLATRPTPVGLLPTGLKRRYQERREDADGVTDWREQRRPQGWRGVCRRGVGIRWSCEQDALQKVKTVRIDPVSAPHRDAGLARRVPQRRGCYAL